MGCCESKQDVVETRQQDHYQALPEEPVHGATPIAIPSVGAPSAVHMGAGGGASAGSYRQAHSLRSVTSLDKRAAEREHQKRVVERAEDEFIEVAQSALELEREDPSDPEAQQFGQMLRNTHVDVSLVVVPRGRLAGAIAACTSGAAAAQVACPISGMVQTDIPTPAVQERIRHIAGHIASSCQGLCLTPPGGEPIVAAFS